MLEVSQAVWQEYHGKCLQARLRRLRKLTTQAAFDLYAEFFQLAAGKEMTPALQKLRRKEKLAIRLRMLAAFRDLDRRRREGRTAGDTP